MTGIEKKVERIMKGERGGVFLESLLLLLSRVYAGLVTLRAGLFLRGFLSRGRLPCPVISIGNLTVGGTGKTPMTIYLVELLKGMGMTPAVVSRGYRGGFERDGGVVSSGAKLLCGPDMAGDEPYMMAKTLEVPVVVGSNRYAASMTAITKFDPDLIVLDDGFQHLKLQRDLDIVLLDASAPFGNGFPTPRGVLREPASALCRGDLFILSRANLADPSLLQEAEERIRKITGGKPVLLAEHTPFLSLVVGDGKIDAGGLKEKSVFAFSGIAGNAGFFSSLLEMGCLLSGTRAFPDHHPYTKGEITELMELAAKSGADCLVTTEKDYVRIQNLLEESPEIPLAVVGVRLRFPDGGRAFSHMIEKFIEGSRDGRSGLFDKPGAFATGGYGKDQCL